MGAALIFDTVPYSAKEAKYWAALGSEVEDYYGPLDDISCLMVGGTDNAHVSDLLLAAEGINQYFSGHPCDAACLLPMADLAERLGGHTLAKKAKAADRTINTSSNWTTQQTDNFIHDALLVLTEEEISQNEQAQARQSFQSFKRAFADWLKAHFPRKEVADIDAYLREKWEQVRNMHPDIWRAYQIGKLGPRIDGESAYTLLKQVGSSGAFKVRKPRPRDDATAPVYFLWIETIEGREVVIVGFADAISLLDVNSWSELARMPASPPLNRSTRWLANQNKQFMIDRDTLQIAEPKLLKPLTKKLNYLT